MTNTRNQNLMWSLLVIVLAVCVSGSAWTESSDHPESGPLIIANAKVAYTLDRESGSLVAMQTKTSGQNVTLPPEASAPFSLWLGTKENLEATTARISVGKQKLSAYRTYVYDNGKGIELNWRDIKTETGDDSAVAVRLYCELDEDASFLRLRADFHCGDTYLISGIFLGIDGLPALADADQELYTVPEYMGKQEPNPRTNLCDREILYTTPSTVPLGMFCSWLDISAPEVGFGTGYLNSQSIDMLGDVKFEATQCRLGWRMFRLIGTWTFMEDLKDPLIYPIEMGESFSTDTWFLGVHDKDWHVTADWYRAEYEKAFADDFLPWDALSPAVKATDVVLNITGAWGVMGDDKVRHDIDRGEVRVPFLDVPDRIDAMRKDLGADPEHCLMVMLGQTTHWGIYKLPDYFPVNAEAGGPEDFKEMIRRVREDIGIAGTHFYVHLAFNHPDADHFAEIADTGWTANLYANYDHLGRIACTDSPDWFQHWRDNVIPGFIEMGASGLEADEGFGHHFICDHPGHNHSLNAVSVLTAQTRGARRIYRAWREAAGPDGYVQCEGGGDIGARYCDLWESGAGGPMEVVRYTHPDKPVVCFAGSPLDGLRAYVYGMHLLVTYKKDMDPIPDAYRKFVSLRKEMREKNAPAYPQCFRDNLGLTVPGTLLAKAYANEDGITVAYCSEEPVQGELLIDSAALGHPESGVVRHPVNLGPLETGYVIVK